MPSAIAVISTGWMWRPSAASANARAPSAVHSNHRLMRNDPAAACARSRHSSAPGSQTAERTTFS